MDIFIAESIRGSHHLLPDFIDAKFFGITFFPGFQSKIRPIKDIYYDVSIKNTQCAIDGMSYRESSRELVSAYGKNIVKMIVAYYDSFECNNIIIGFDFDKQGDLMSSLLRYHLIREGISPNNIIRMPLTEIGYIGTGDGGETTEGSEAYMKFAFSDFMSDDQLYCVLEAARQEAEMMTCSTNRTLVGYRKMFAMRHIERIRANSAYKIERLNLFSNFCTYISNFAIWARREYIAKQKKMEK